jgi:sulfur carrier protein ThiS
MGLSFAGGCTGLEVTKDDPAVARLVASSDYDRELCTIAQRLLLNAASDAYRTHTLVAEGGTFITEQMNTDAATQTVTVAALLETVQINGTELAVDMACKMVNRDRANDVLQLGLDGPTGTCRDINQLTYALALRQLSPAERAHYLADGVPLKFVADYEAPTGGAWLASVVSDYIQPAGTGARPDHIVVQSPSVRVPWPDAGGEWFQGTHHCKLITLAAMTRWMKVGAFDGSTELFPQPRPECVEPDSRTSGAGSCLLYFGPAGAQFCQDYSGSGWTENSAREDCAIRHSTLAAWNDKSASYDGGGGLFSPQSCVERGAVTEAEKEPVGRPDSAYLGTCVFRCNTPDEALWHQLSPMANDPEGRGLERTCDLFLKLDW